MLFEGKLSTDQANEIKKLLKETLLDEGFDDDSIRIDYNTGACRHNDDVGVFMFDVWIDSKRISHAYLEKLISTYRKRYKQWQLPLPLYTGSDCTIVDLEPKAERMTSQSKVGID